MNRAQVELLTRDGCGICHRVYDRLAELSAELGFDLSATDVDAAAAAEVALTPMTPHRQARVRGVPGRGRRCWAR